MRGAPNQPHLAGPFAPVRTEDDFELTVRGRIPGGLAGAYYRNGPNPQFDPEGPYLSIFGDGMIHAVFLEPGPNGGRAHYRNRWVRTPKWEAERRAGRAVFGLPGTPVDLALAHIPRGPANTHVVHHAGKLMALQEQSEPFELDPQGLEKGAFLTTGGKFTAHPKLDPESGELLWFAYFAGPERFSRQIDFGIMSPDGTITRRERFAAPYASVIHDFLVTRRYVLFPVLPLTASVARAMQGLPALAWDPDQGAYLGVMERAAGAESLRWVEVDPCFVLHAMNAWEEEGKIHGELIELPHAPVFPTADGSPGAPAEGRLTRWTLDRTDSSARVRRCRLDDLNSELPRIDDRRAGLPYRHGWYAASLRGGPPGVFDAIVHVDWKTGCRTVRAFEPGDVAGEPVFVPRAPDAPEGDGYVLCFVYRAAGDMSELQILPAREIDGEPAAVLELPRRVPAGFHGSFVPAK